MKQYKQYRKYAENPEKYYPDSEKDTLPNINIPDFEELEKEKAKTTTKENKKTSQKENKKENKTNQNNNDNKGEEDMELEEQINNTPKVETEENKDNSQKEIQEPEPGFLDRYGKYIWIASGTITAVIITAIMYKKLKGMNFGGDSGNGGGSKTETKSEPEDTGPNYFTIDNL